LSAKQIRIYVSYVSVTYLILHKELKEAKRGSSATTILMHMRQF